MKFGLSDKAYNRILKACGSEEQVKTLIAFWGVKACERGYVAVDYEGTGLLCIEKIDDLGIFNNDTEATKQAIKDGVNIIPVKDLPKDMPSDLKFFGYIDTHQNRQKLKELYGPSIQSEVVKQPKSSVNTREQKVAEIKRRFDKIYDVYEDTSFTEITGSTGGDTLTFRVYNNGTVTER